jgi:prepilin-type processing-associated H-X9-DG protein
VVRPTASSVGAIVPIHSGIMNVTFCDGHCEQVAADPDVVCTNYDCTDISTYSP